MKEKIIELLNNIEVKYQVQILFAIEAGSRAWGFQSHDSDYDVRFVYIPPITRYLTLDKQRDVIEETINDIDLVGWDLKKALSLFRNTNPNFIEWLYSPTTYSENIHHGLNLRQELISCLPQYISRKAIMSHYLGMSKRNWKEYLQKEPVWTKKYLYVIRPLLACIWFENIGTAPPVLFDELIEACTPRLKPELITSIHQLVARKKAGDELSTGPRIPEIHEFITEKMPYFEELSKSEAVIPKETFLEFTAFLVDLFHNLLNFRSAEELNLIGTWQIRGFPQTTGELYDTDENPNSNKTNTGRTQK